MAAVNLRIVSATHVGKVRGNNEDAYVITDRSVYPPVFAVADGMGGHAAGEVASRMAVDIARGANGLFNTLGDAEEALRQIFVAAHEALLQAASDDRFGMGTTLTLCLVEGQTLHVGHAGDSSAFLIRGERVLPLTIPASSGHALAAGLGVAPSFFKSMDYTRHDLQPADVVVLCTDGLTRYLDAPWICRVVRKTPFDEVADALVQRALAGGGEDNVTVIAALVG